MMDGLMYCILLWWIDWWIVSYYENGLMYCILLWGWTDVLYPSMRMNWCTLSYFGRWTDELYPTMVDGLMNCILLWWIDWWTVSYY